jgi:hypothetical protein
MGSRLLYVYVHDITRPVCQTVLVGMNPQGNRKEGRREVLYREV